MIEVTRGFPPAPAPSTAVRSTVCVAVAAHEVGQCGPRNGPMQITLYHRTFPVKDAPAAASFAPFDGQTSTLTVGGEVFEAEYTQLTVVVPDDAKFDPARLRLTWRDGKRPMYSKARDVLDLARANASGFRVAKRPAPPPKGRPRRGAGGS